MLISCEFTNNKEISYNGSNLIVNNKVSKEKVLFKFKQVNQLSTNGEKKDLLFFKNKKQCFLLNKRNNYLYKLDSSFNKSDSLFLKPILKIEKDINALYLHKDSIRIFSKKTNTAYSFMFSKPVKFSEKVSDNNFDRLVENNNGITAKVETSLFLERSKIKAQSELSLNSNKIIYHYQKIFLNKNPFSLKNKNDNIVINFCLNDSLLLVVVGFLIFVALSWIMGFKS